MKEERRVAWMNEWQKVNDGKNLKSHYSTHKESQKWRQRFISMGVIVRRTKMTPEQKKEKLRAYKKKYYLDWRKNNKERMKLYTETFWRKKLKMESVDYNLTDTVDYNLDDDFAI